MSADRAGPWSRWDGLPADQTNQIYPSVGNGRLFDNSVGQQQQMQQQMTAGQFGFLRSTLVDQRINTIDPSFYDCIYGVQNSVQTVVERCYKDLGCCPTGCCKNSEWQRRYAAAVALIVIFGALVIIAVAIWLVVWLINRAKDKKQKRQLIGSTGMSPAASNMSLAQPIQGGYHFGTGPYQTPPGNGYRY